MSKQKKWGDAILTLNMKKKCTLKNKMDNHITVKYYFKIISSKDNFSEIN